MDNKVQVGELVTEEQSAQMKAALALEGLSQREWCKREGISYLTGNKLISRGRPVTTTYEPHLNSLLATFAERAKATAEAAE